MDSLRDITEYELFGYFKQDFTRKIFFLFPNIKLSDYRLIYDVSKVRHLTVVIVRSQVIEDVNNNSTGFTSLIRLELLNSEFAVRFFVRNNLYDEEDLDGFLSKDNSFPNLKYLVFDPIDSSEGVAQEGVVDTTDWNPNLKLWKQLEVLENSRTELLEYFSRIDNFYENGGLKNLKELKMKNITEPYEMVLPSLDELRLSQCERLSITNSVNEQILSTRTSSMPEKKSQITLIEFSECNDVSVNVGAMEKLVSFDVENCDVGSIQRIYEQSPKLESFLLENQRISDEGIEHSWIFDTKKPDLGTLKLKRIVLPVVPQNSSFFNPQSYGSFNNIPINGTLQKLVISECPNFDNSSLSRINLPKCKEMTLSRLIRFTGEERCSVFQKIEVLKMKYLDNLTDTFFRIHDMNKLKRLKLTSCDRILGTDWSRMESLYDFQLVDMLNYTIPYAGTEKPEDLEFEVCILKEYIVVLVGYKDEKVEEEDMKLPPLRTELLTEQFTSAVRFWTRIPGVYSIDKENCPNIHTKRRNMSYVARPSYIGDIVKKYDEGKQKKVVLVRNKKKEKKEKEKEKEKSGDWRERYQKLKKIEKEEEEKAALKKSLNDTKGKKKEEKPPKKEEEAKTVEKKKDKKKKKKKKKKISSRRRIRTPPRVMKTRNVYNFSPEIIIRNTHSSIRTGRKLSCLPKKQKNLQNCLRIQKSFFRNSTKTDNNNKKKKKKKKNLKKKKNVSSSKAKQKSKMERKKKKKIEKNL